MPTFYFDHKDKTMKLVEASIESSPNVQIFAQGELSITRNMAGSYYAINIGEMKEAIVAIPTIDGEEVGIAVRTHGLARISPDVYTLEMAQRLQTLASSRLLQKVIWNCIGLDVDSEEPFTTVTTVRIIKSQVDRKQPTIRLCEAQLSHNRSMIFYTPADRSMGVISNYRLHRNQTKVTAIAPKY